jgi:hypothetical protein
MGCGNSNAFVVNEQTKMNQSNISLILNNEKENDNLNNDLNYAQTLIDLITQLRNRFIYLYHNLEYSTAGCIYLKPDILHCLYNLWYKMSADCRGKLSRSGFVYLSDVPFFECKIEEFPEDTQKLIKQFQDFIVEINSYIIFIKQIDRKIPQLFYLIIEKKKYITEYNFNNINYAISLFKQMENIRVKILDEYEREINKLFVKRDAYFNKFDIVGREAYDNKITDIYEIAFLKKKFMTEDEKNDEDEKTYKNINQAKKIMKKQLVKDKEGAEEINYKIIDLL